MDEHRFDDDGGANPPAVTQVVLEDRKHRPWRYYRLSHFQLMEMLDTQAAELHRLRTGDSATP